MHTEIKEKIKSILNINSTDSITEFDLNVTGSTANKIANKGNVSIYGFIITIDNKITKIVAKRKSKAIVTNTKILLNIQNSKEFENLYQSNYAVLGLKNSDIREYLIYENIIEKIKNYMPKYLENINNPSENILLIEYFNNSHDRINNDLIIDFLTSLHSYYLDKKEIVKHFMLNYCSIDEYKKAKQLLLLILENFVKLYEDILPPKILNGIKNSINNFDNIIKKMYSYHLTFNHGDFTYKNMCLINNKICVYDWEMASFLNPQFDIVTYLSYVNTESISKEFIDDFVNKYIIKFANKSHISINKNVFYDILKLNIDYFFIIRLMGLLIMHKRMPMPHIEKVLKNWIKIYDLINIQ